VVGWIGEVIDLPLDYFKNNIQWGDNLPETQEEIYELYTQVLENNI
jgi:hypothetical protein